MIDNAVVVELFAVTVARTLADVPVTDDAMPIVTVGADSVAEAGGALTPA